MTVGIPAFSVSQSHSLLHGLGDAGPAAALGAAALAARSHRRWSSSMATLVLLAGTAAYIHLSGGLIEMHFLFFVLLGVVTLYQDWLPFLLAIGFTALHHASAGLGDPASVFNHPAAQRHPVTWALIHAGFVGAASVVNLIAWKANEELMVRDWLTKLPNRKGLTEKIDSALATGTAAVLFIDLCGFKSVNDSLGHDAGDAVLREVAGRLRRAVRDGDDVARFGGDEFAVVLYGATEGEAEDAATRLVNAVAEPFGVGGVELSIGASIGIALSGIDAVTTSAILRKADSAMYAAKRNGGGTGSVARFVPSMEEAHAHRLTMEMALSGALERRELRLHYQPVIRLRDNEVVGAEALLRWEHPTLGHLSPAEFIPLAEETGLIVPIGAWVLEEACRAAAGWPATADGAPLKISVNVSVRQLRDSALVGTVARALARSGLEPSALCLEITEGEWMFDATQGGELLHDLKRLGIRLSMDDFGTGYSSLTRLKSFPLDYLKVDRSFVDKLSSGSDPDARAIVSCIVGLGHAMGMVVVAEGVENDDQLRALLELRCEAGQGWRWSKAVPEAEFLAWLGRPAPAGLLVA